MTGVQTCALPIYLSGGYVIPNVIYGAYQSGLTTNPSYKDSGLGNIDLTWEKSLSYNVGFDFSMWNGKLSMEVDGFYNYVFDMLTLQNSGYPASMGGYYMSYINHNAYDTKGVDVLVAHRNHFMLGGKPFQYGVSGTVTFARSRWLVYQDEPNTPDNPIVNLKFFAS